MNLKAKLNTNARECGYSVKGYTNRNGSGVCFESSSSKASPLHCIFRRHRLLSTSLRLPILKMSCMWKIFPEEFAITDFLPRENFSEAALELCPRGRFQGPASIYLSRQIILREVVLKAFIPEVALLSSGSLD